MRDLQPVRSEVTAFLERMKSAPRGRLIFGLDATMSRQETWDTACHLQGQMFDEAAAVGGLDIQLIYIAASPNAGRRAGYRRRTSWPA